MDTTAIQQVLVLSVVIVVLVQRLKPLREKSAKADLISLYVPYILGTFLAIFAKADILSPIGINVGAPMIAYIVTGVIICGGSNAIYDILKGIKETLTSIATKNGV